MLETVTPQEIIYLLTAVTNLVLGVYSYIKNPKSKNNQLFLLLILLVVGWITTLYLFYESSNPAFVLAVGRLNFVFGLNIFSFLYLFTLVYPESKLKVSPKAVFIIIAQSIILSFITYFTDLIDKQEIIKGEDRETIFGTLYPLYLLHIVVYTSLSVKTLLEKYRLYMGLAKTQLRYLFVGIGGALVIGLSTNIILPFFGVYTLQALGPASTLFLIVAISYSMLRHRLFGVNYILTQSLRYVVEVLFTVIFVYIAVGIQQYIWGSIYRLEAILEAFLFAGLYILLYNKINKTFNKGWLKGTILSKYNAQEIAGEIAENLSKKLDRKDIVATIYNTLSKIFNTSQIAFWLIREKDIKRIDTYARKVFKQTDISQYLATRLLLSPDSIIVLDEMYAKDNSNSDPIVVWMAENEIDAVAKIYVDKDYSVVIIFGRRNVDVGYPAEDIDLIHQVLTVTQVALSRSLLYQEVQNFNATLQQRIDEATADLQQKNTDLKRLRDRERDMMDIMGHELRTPLTIIKMTLGLLKTKAEKLNAKFEKDEFDIYYVRMKEAIEREIRLLETMLSSTKLDANRMEIHLEKVDFLPMIKDAMLAQQEKAEEKGLKFVFDDPEIPIEVFADRVRLPEVIDNLVSNAVKYTEEGHVKIKIDTDSHANYILVAVSDTGIGIPEDALPHLGTKFFRVQQHLEKVHREAERKASIVRPGGTGLGLHVSYGLTEMMGGKILVESEIGKGSTFTIKIPKFIDQQEVDFREDGRDAFARMGLTKNGAKATKKVKKSTAKTGSKMTKERVKRGEKDSHLSVVELLAQDQEE